MTVKKIIKVGVRYLTSSKYRFLINAKMGKYNRMSDEEYLKRKFQIVMGKPLNLQNPKTYNEKLQWLKLHDRKPEYTRMVDKYEAKKYVAEQIGEEYIVPNFGVWDKFEDIDFDSLPNQFVLKCTHDCGGLVICKDKTKLDKRAAKKMIERCLRHDYYWDHREWPYKDVKPRVIAEAYMEDGNSGGLRDYKFFCFNGEPKILYVSQGLENHSTASISFYDLQGTPMTFRRSDFKTIAENIEWPSNFEKMKQIAKKLAIGIDCPFVRVDMYCVGGRIYFSEITFFPCAGYLPFEPEEWDYTLGSWINLPMNHCD